MQFVNIGVLNSKIKSLKYKIENLADEVKTLKAGKQVNEATDPDKIIHNKGAKK